MADRRPIECTCCRSRRGLVAKRRSRRICVNVAQRRRSLERARRYVHRVTTDLHAVLKVAARHCCQPIVFRRKPRISKSMRSIQRPSAVSEEAIRKPIDICDPGIANIDPAEVERAHVIPREERFAEAQRAPAESASEPETKADAKARSAPP